MTTEEQQEIVLDVLDKAFEEMLADHPSVGRVVASVTLIDLAVHRARKQGASLEHVHRRVDMAWDESVNDAPVRASDTELS